MQIAEPVAADSTTSTTEAPKTDLRLIAARVLAIIVPLALWFSPLNLDPTTKHAFAIGLFMILAWITGALPHVVTGLIGCFLFWSLHVVPFETAFSGFASETPWFYFGAMLFGMLATETQLATRIAVHVMLFVGNSYSRILLGLILLSFLLTFLVPSGAVCVVIMASVAIGLLKAYGLDKRSNIARGMFVTLTYTAGLFDKMVVAGPASILGRGLIIKTTHIEIYWSKWVLAYLPLSIATIVAMWATVLWLYPAEQKTLIGGEEYLKEQLVRMGRVTRVEKHALLLMLIGIALWATDSFHHISPAIIGLGIGLVAVLPGIGVLNVKNIEKINYVSMFFVAAAASLGQVLVQTKAIDLLTRYMFSWMAPLLTNKISLVLVPYWTAFVYHIFLGNDIAMLASSIPPLMHFAMSRSIDPLAIGMIWILAAGGKIFVYQSGVMIVGYSYGYFDSKDLLRVGLVLSVVETLLILLVVPFYWPLLGI